MNLSLSVLATILFLAPGIAGFLGGLLGARGGSVRRATPAANSLPALIAIVLLAIAAHAFASLLLAAQDEYCRIERCFTVDFDPDAYGHIVRASRDPSVAFRSADVFYAFVALMLLCLVTGGVAMAAVAADMRRGVRSFAAAIFYGWLAPVSARSTGGLTIVVAYVLTKMRGGDLAIGYRGMVGEINLTPDKEVGSITLIAADRFGVRLSPTEPGREHSVVLAELLPLVHVPGREIENIVLNVVPLDQAEGADAS